MHCCSCYEPSRSGRRIVFLFYPSPARSLQGRRNREAWIQFGPLSMKCGIKTAMSGSPVNGQLRNRRERLSHQVDNPGHFWHTEKRSQ